ncbi:MAG: flagellar biosynthetic protein FliO [Candidatus Thiodiazotropha sp.]
MRLWSYLLLLSCHTLYAADSAEKQLGANLPPLGAESLLNTAGGLLLVLAIIVGGAWLFKRYAQLPMGGKGLVRVVGGVSLGTRERAVLVEVENNRLLLGVAPGQVRTLYVLQGSQQSFQNHLESEKGSIAAIDGSQGSA